MSPEERQALMNEHMKTMHEGMETMKGMQGMKGMGGMGMGGMGVLAVPLVYEGWVQKVPSSPVNDQLIALVQSTREALANAARHSGAMWSRIRSTMGAE